MNANSRGYLRILLDNRVPPIPPTPTDTRPGTDERIKVYTERVKQGFQVFHPNDITLRRLQCDGPTA